MEKEKKSKKNYKVQKSNLFSEDNSDEETIGDMDEQSNNIPNSQKIKTKYFPKMDEE